MRVIGGMGVGIFGIDCAGFRGFVYGLEVIYFWVLLVFK